MDSEINVRDYIHEIFLLESEKYRLESVKDSIQESIVSLQHSSSVSQESYVKEDKIQESKISELKNLKNDLDRKYKLTAVPRKPVLNTAALRKTSSLKEIIIKQIGILLTAAFCLVLSYVYIREWLLFAIILLILGISILIYGIIEISKIQSNQKIRQSNEMILNKHDQDVISYNDKLSKVEAINRQLSKARNEEFEIQLERIESKYKNQIESKNAEYKAFISSLENGEALLNELIGEADRNISIIEAKLNDMYNQNVIFEKYRYYVAISTFDEYFQSYRVDTLEGRDGAYNLYETEIRSNLIITKLSQISDKLDQIKQNQFLLYKQMKETKASVDSIRHDLGFLSGSVNNIDEAMDVLLKLENKKNDIITSINRNTRTIRNITLVDYLMS